MDTGLSPPKNAMVFLASEDILSSCLLFLSQAMKARIIIQFDFMPLASFLSQWQLFDEPRATLNFT